jgi:hypothetical protein
LNASAANDRDAPARRLGLWPGTYIVVVPGAEGVAADRATVGKVSNKVMGTEVGGAAEAIKLPSGGRGAGYNFATAAPQAAAPPARRR